MQATKKNKRSHLTALIQRWETRRRWQRVVLYLPRVMLATFLGGTLLTLVLWFVVGVTDNVVMVGTVAAAMSFLTGTLVSALRLYGSGGMETAQYFDGAFGLQERISTALELMEARIVAAPQIADQQIADALAHAESIDAEDKLPLRVDWLQWVFAGLALFLFALVMGGFLVFNFAAGRGETDANTRQQITQAADDVRDITEEVATDTALTPEERDSLLESLEVSLDELELDDTTGEDAFVNMSELESDLREQVEAMRDDLAAQDESLQAGSDALDGTSPDETSAGENPAQSGAQQMEQRLQDAQESLQNMTAAERQQLAEQAQQAAEQTAQQAPELSQRLQEAAEALQSGDEQGAREALDQAQQETQNLQQQQQDRADSADNLEEAADQAQQSAEEIADAESQQNQPQQQTDDEQQAQNGQEQSSQQNQQGQEQQTQPQQADEQQQGQQGQQGDQPSQQSQSEQAQQGEGQQSQSSEQGQSSEQSDSGQAQGGQEGDPDEQGQQAQQGEPQASDAGQGAAAGTGESSGSEQTGQQQQADGQSPSSAGDSGERAYEQIYAPQSLDNGDGSSDIRLETDASDAPAREGDFRENPSGTSSVPYNEVYSDYVDSANRALETDYVPLGLRDVVRDYFQSLEPDN